MKKYFLPLLIGAAIGLTIAGALIAYEFLTTEEHLDPWRPADAPPRKKRRAQTGTERPVFVEDGPDIRPTWV